MLGTPGVIGEINKVKLPYNINFFSEHVARVLLGRLDIVEARSRELPVRRDELFSFLQSLPLDAVYRSAANFILFRCCRKNELLEFLKKKNILVRDVSQYPCSRTAFGSTWARPRKQGPSRTHYRNFSRRAGHRARGSRKG